MIGHPSKAEWTDQWPDVYTLRLQVERLPRMCGDTGERCEQAVKPTANP